MSVPEDFGKRLATLGLERWHSRTGLVAAIAGVLLIGILLFAGITLANVSPAEWVILGSVVLAVVVAWFLTRVERVPSDRVGFGVAINYENSEDAKQLRSDFVLTLRDLLHGSENLHRFQFIAFPDSLAKWVAGEEQAKWLARKANLRFLIHGRARLRNLPKGPAYVLDLGWLVTHAPLDKRESDEFKADALTVFPARMILVSPDNLIACEFAAHHVDAVARYVIGTAAALSEDFPYAERLLLDAEAKLVSYVKQAEGAALSVLLGRVKARIGELYSAWLDTLSRQYALKRERHFLEEAEALVPRLQAYRDDKYPGYLTAAMAAFMLRRDIDEARRQLQKCRTSQDATWKYSDAFLIAYEGDLDGAYRVYRNALESPLDEPTVPMQCEEFIQIVLDEEPERKWLYFCLGILNHRAKGDLLRARKDFATFVAGVDPARFKAHIKIAQKWIGEIDAVIDHHSSRAKDDQ